VLSASSRTAERTSGTARSMTRAGLRDRWWAAATLIQQLSRKKAQARTIRESTSMGQEEVGLFGSRALCKAANADEQDKACAGQLKAL